MNAIFSYFKGWINEIGAFRFYRNTLIATLTVALITLISRHNNPARLFLARDQLMYLLPITLLVNGLILFFIPLLTVPLLKSVDRFGFRVGNVRTWVVDVGAAWAVLVVLIVIFGRSEEFQRTYPLYKPAATAWKIFVLYQLAQLVYMFGWEFLFRGYLLFSAKKEIGALPAVILQMLPFAYLHIGKPELELYGSVFAGIFLGLIALRANSFLPCVILHFAVALTMDLFAVLY